MMMAKNVSAFIFYKKIEKVLHFLSKCDIIFLLKMICSI